MKRKLAVVICLLFLASGIIRLGVGGVMIGQTLQWWSFEGEAAETLVDTQRFISEHPVNLVGFTPITYFAFIALMGVFVGLGAVGSILRKRWGLALIGLYLLCHLALFVNFMTLNPKVALLVIAALLALVVWWANRAQDADARPSTET